MRTCSVCGGFPAGHLDGCCGCATGGDAGRLCSAEALLTESADSQWVRLLAARLGLCGIPWRLESPETAGVQPSLVEPVGTTTALFVPREMLEEARRVLLWEMAAN